MSKRIKKVVIPVAGLGTRVLPATKSIPKELLPVVDRPLIDYVVAEARDAGIEHVILVTGRGKSAIEDYFDHAFELETTLRTKAKTDILADIEKTIPRAGDLSYTRQQAPLGLGHGVIAPKSRKGNLIEMSGMVEKPKPAEAPSNFRIIGRYILQPDIFRLLETQDKGAGGEIQLTDSMNRLNAEQTFHACICEGVIHDCGSKLGWLTANVDLGLKDKALGAAFGDYVRLRMK